MYSIYYIGAQNSERIDFCQWPYIVTGGDFIGYDAAQVEGGNRTHLTVVLKAIRKCS